MNFSVGVFMNIASGLAFANGIETNFARLNFQKVYIVILLVKRVTLTLFLNLRILIDYK